MANSDGSHEHARVRASEHERTGVRRKVMLATAGVVGVGALLLTGWFSLTASESDRAMPGVHVEGMDVSRLTRAEIRQRVQAWGAPRATQQIPFPIAGPSQVFEPEIAGLSVDAEASASRALQVGRGSGLARGLSSFVARWFHPESVAAVVHFDPQRLSALLDDWEARAIDVQHAPFPGGISVDGTNVTALYPHPGQRLDRARVGP